MLNNIRDLGLDISINNILYGNSYFAYDVNCSLFTAVHKKCHLLSYYKFALNEYVEYLPDVNQTKDI
jgi:hypothetical protein